MARGQPDYGPSHRSIYGAGLSDLGELAVRLGSPVIFDRRGQVIDYDDFEGTVLKWTVIQIGSGAAALDSTMPRSGAQGVKLTSGSGALNHATLSKGFTPLASQRLGLECVFANPSTDTYLVLQIGYFDGTTSYLAGIRFDFNAQKIAYRTGGLAYTDIIDTDAFNTTSFFYFPIKLVADFEAGLFVRLLFGGAQHDLSAYPIFSTDSATNPKLDFRIAHERRAGTGDAVYIDDVILTQDEP